MADWAKPAREDLERLREKAASMRRVSELDLSRDDRRSVLSSMVGHLWPQMELHFRQMAESFLPALEKRFKEKDRPVQTLQENRQRLRLHLRRLSEGLQDPGRLEWGSLRSTVEALLEAMEERAFVQDRLLLEVLRHSRPAPELQVLAERYKRSGRQAHEEEGWPGLPRKRLHSRLSHL